MWLLLTRSVFLVLIELFEWFSIATIRGVFDVYCFVRVRCEYWTRVLKRCFVLPHANYLHVQTALEYTSAMHNWMHVVSAMATAAPAKVSGARYARYGRHRNTDLSCSRICLSHSICIVLSAYAGLYRLHWRVQWRCGGGCMWCVRRRQHLMCRSGP